MKKKYYTAIILRSQSTMILHTSSHNHICVQVAAYQHVPIYIWNLRAHIFALWTALWLDPSLMMVAHQCGNYERKRGATHWGVPWAWWCKRKEPFHQSIDAQLLVHHPLPSCIILESLRSSWAVAELQWPPVWLLSPTKPPMWKMWGPPSVSITFHVKGFYFAFLVSPLRAFTLFGASLQTHLIF